MWQFVCSKCSLYADRAQHVGNKCSCFSHSKPCSVLLVQSSGQPQLKLKHMEEKSHRAYFQGMAFISSV